MGEMGPENDQHNHHDAGFGNPQWAEIIRYSSSQQQSPIQEYHGLNFFPTQHMPTGGATYSRIEPSVHTQSHTPHQQLHPLIMPQWPSMLTSQSTFAPSNVSAAPAASASTPISAPISAPSSAATSTPVSATPSNTSTHSTSTPRRTLTDTDRRRMCVYHEENPTVKQTEIGGKKLRPKRLRKYKLIKFISSNVRRRKKVQTLLNFDLLRGR